MRDGVARTRHLRHRSYARTKRSKGLRDFYLDEATRLAATATGMAFTAAAGTVLTTAATPTGIRGPFVVSNAGGALPSPLVAGTRYYMRFLSATTFSLHVSRRDAGLNLRPITLAGAGTGTHTIVRASAGPDIFEVTRRAANVPERVATVADIDTLN